MRMPLVLVPGLALGLVLGACSPSGAGDGIKVAATVYPVEFAAAEIGGDRIEVVNVTPPGAEPHDVELGSDQVVHLVESDLIVYLGDGFQPAVEEGLNDAEGVTLDALASVRPPEDGDAHFWLDPTQLAEVVDTIAAQLADVDPESGDDYRSAATELHARLADLDARYEEGLADCRSNAVVTSHEAFGYLADRYGLRQIGISGLDPEGEPSPQRIAEVAEFVRANDVKTIFFETLLSPAAAETIARETGADTAVLDPLESEPDDGDYFTAMEQNLASLQEALECR